MKTRRRRRRKMETLVESIRRGSEWYLRRGYTAGEVSWAMFTVARELQKIATEETNKDE